MKVYLLMEYIPYEGSSILGVYAAEERAEVELAKLGKPKYYVDYGVEEHEVKP